MNEFFKMGWTYLVSVGQVSRLQLLVLFGPLLLLSFVMHFLSVLNLRLSLNTIGRTIYVYFFGWLGVMFHELGHALFAWLFGHKIKEVKLFKPDPKSGTLGYVKHSFNSKNIYHQVGNFFIGIGPVLMCVGVLYLLSIYLLNVSFSKLPNFEFSLENQSVWDWIKQLAIQVWGFVSIFFSSIYSDDQTSWWKLLLFVYFFYSIGSFITLSPADIKSAGIGFLIIILLFILFNVFTLWMGDFTLRTLSQVNLFLSGFYLVMILAILLQILFILILSIFYFMKLIFVK